MRSSRPRRGSAHAVLAVAVLWACLAAAAPHAPAAPLCTPAEPLDKACADCVVRVFVDAHLKYEMKWVMQFLLSGFLDACGKHTQMRWRQDFLKAHECPGLPTVLVAMHGLQDHETEYVLRQPDEITRHFYLIHLSDELYLHNLTAYPKFGAVWRNYWRRETNLTLDYLKPDAPIPPPPAPTNIFWMPLGCGPNLLHHPSLVTPLGARQLLFSWSGSMTGKQFGGNEERRLFVDILRNQSDLMPRGDLFEFEQWDGGGERTTTRYYSQLMYNTRIVPCPLANNAEQYRIWEAMEVGAMPVLKLKNVRRHAHLPALKIPFLTVDAWEDLPALLRHWDDPKNAAELEERARDVYVRWADIKTKLHTHIAHTVCERFPATA